jgi:predicted nuclease of predicted toxin-antitoxin system
VTFWLDAQLPPQLAPWLTTTFGVESYSLRFMGLHEAEDTDIFQKAKEANITLISKDEDFIALVQRLGIPPQLVWVTVGNLTNANLRNVFSRGFPTVLQLLENGADIVELGQ